MSFQNGYIVNSYIFTRNYEIKKASRNQSLPWKVRKQDVDHALASIGWSMYLLPTTTAGYNTNVNKIYKILYLF